MLTDLQNKNLGNIENIRFVLHNVVSFKFRSITDIKKYCSDKNVELVHSIDGMILLLVYLELIIHSKNSIKINGQKKLDWIYEEDKKVFGRLMAYEVLKKLLDESELTNFINIEKIRFDQVNNKLSIQNCSIPIAFSSIRNLMIELGVFVINPIFPSNLLISSDIQPFFESTLIPWLIDQSVMKEIDLIRNHISLEQLLRIQELKNQNGIQAEEVIVKFEQKRLYNHPQMAKIRRISDIDVSAGFDILSFQGINSNQFDCFIEVKSFSKNLSFYWSQNEIKTAEIKREKYFLYLVDREKIDDVNFSPIIIKDPYINVFQNDNWQRDAQNWLIRRMNN